MNEPSQRLDVNRDTDLHNFDKLNPESKKAVIAESVSQLSPESKKAVIAESVSQLSPQDREEIMQAGLRPAGQQVSDQVWLIIA